MLHLALEEHPALVIERYNNLGVDERRVAILSDLEQPAPFKMLEESLLHWCPVLVIFDPIMRFVKLDNAYDYAQVSNALDPLIHLMRKYRTHGVMVTHSPHTATRSLGSQAWDGACSTQLTLEREGIDRYLSITGRGGVEEVDKAVLRLDDSGWVSTYGTKADVKADDKQREIMGLIIDRLDELPNDTVNGIQKAIKRRRADVKAALGRLLTLKQIRAFGVGGRGGPVMYSLISVAVPEPELVPGTQ